MRKCSTALLLFVASISAVDAQQSNTLRTCAHDLSKLCAGIAPGQGNLGHCIAGEFRKLSPSCKVSLAGAARSAKTCLTDVKRLCAGVQPGGGRIEGCMKARLAQVGPDCKAALSRLIAGGL